MIVPCHAIVYRSQMAIWIFFLNYFKEAVPILLLFLFHEIKFICQGPPDISKGTQTCNNIPKIKIILFITHAVETPMSIIVRMKEDKVTLDIQLIQLHNSFFQVTKKFRIKSPAIPVIRCCSLIWIQLGLGTVKRIPFGEYTHSDFVEGGIFKCFQGFHLNVFGLMNPGITGGAEGKERCPVIIFETIRIGHPYDSMTFF